MSEEIKKETQDEELKLDDLEEVAGGARWWGQPDDHWETVTDNPGKIITCPKCGSKSLSISKYYSDKHVDFTCNGCGNKFTIQLS